MFVLNTLNSCVIDLLVFSKCKLLLEPISSLLLLSESMSIFLTLTSNSSHLKAYVITWRDLSSIQKLKFYLLGRFGVEGYWIMYFVLSICFLLILCSPTYSSLTHKPSLSFSIFLYLSLSLRMSHSMFLSLSSSFILPKITLTTYILLPAKSWEYLYLFHWYWYLFLFISFINVNMLAVVSNNSYINYNNFHSQAKFYGHTYI